MNAVEAFVTIRECARELTRLDERAMRGEAHRDAALGTVRLVRARLAGVESVLERDVARGGEEGRE